MNKLRVGIVGTGFTIGIAKRHVEGYEANERTELVAMYDIVPGKSRHWAEKKQLTGISFCESLDELFGLVDAVSICTPNHTHAELVVRALEAGKHVLCEKPFAPCCEDAMPAVEASEKHPELISMICFNYREIPAIKLMKQIIDEGKLGRVFTVRQKLGGARMSDPTNVKLEWRMQEKYSGTGALGDFSCHMLDLADYLLTPTQGKMTEVSGTVSTFVNERYELDNPSAKGMVTNDDAAVFFARTENGALYNFTSSRVSRPGHYFEISAEGGILVYDSNIGDEKLEIYLKDKNGSYPKGGATIAGVPEEMLGENDHIGIINAFASAILDGKMDSRDMKRGLYIQNIIDMVKKSSDEKKVIRL